MNYIGLAVSFIIGLFLNQFLPSYTSKKGENLATKEDIGKITLEIEAVKNIFKKEQELSKTEKDFYLTMIEKIYEFSAQIKKCDFEKKIPVTEAIFLADPILKQKLFEFKDSASEFVGKSFVFLKEESFSNLQKALDSSINFRDMHNNLLDAMRKSIHPDTQLSAKNGDLKEFHY
jgi:hypothetical protein